MRNLLSLDTEVDGKLLKNQLILGHKLNHLVRVLVIEYSVITTLLQLKLNVLLLGR